jgi:hypothetical protein
MLGYLSLNWVASPGLPPRSAPGISSAIGAQTQSQSFSFLKPFKLLPKSMLQTSHENAHLCPLERA